MPLFRFFKPALFAFALCGAPALHRRKVFPTAARRDREDRQGLPAFDPEVLEEVSADLSKRQLGRNLEHEAAVTKNAQAIFNSPRGVTVGNKDGNVTFVEFFDYNCGYCKRAMTDISS